MNTARYRVGGHLLEIRCDNERNDLELLHSFRPFVVNEDEACDEQPLFVLTIDDSFHYQGQCDEVGQFDASGNNYGVYQTAEDGYIIQISNPEDLYCGMLYANADFSRCVVALAQVAAENRHFALNNSLMMAYAFAAADRQTVLLHASVIRKDGYGYLMTAPSGTGKSTHTYLWYKNIPGCDLMNDDNPVVRIVDGKAMVYGTPWSGKTPCYRNIQAPVGAVVRIRQRKQNEIRRMAPIEALSELLPAASSMKWDKRVYLGVCDTLSAIIETVGIYELGCLPDAEAALLCYNTVGIKN